MSMNNKRFFVAVVIMLFNFLCFVPLAQAQSLEFDTWLNQYAHSNFFVAERKVIPIENNNFLLPDNYIKHFFNSEQQEIILPSFAKEFIHSLYWPTRKMFLRQFNIEAKENRFFINTDTIDCNQVRDQRAHNYQHAIINAITQLNEGELLIVETGKAHALDVFLALDSNILENTGIFFQIDDDTDVQSDLRHEKASFYKWAFNQTISIEEQLTFKIKQEVFRQEVLGYGQKHNQKTINKRMTVFLIEKYKQIYCKKIDRTTITVEHVDLGLYTSQVAKTKNAIIFSDTHNLQQPLAIKKLPSAQQLKDKGIHTVKVMLERFSLEEGEASQLNDNAYAIENRAVTRIFKNHVRTIAKDYPRLHHAVYEKYNQQNMSVLERIDERATLMNKLASYEQANTTQVEYINNLEE